jgi:hypothetical protein
MKMTEESLNITVKRWTPDYKGEWDALVNNGKNSNFIFVRDYMDYHSDRFHDHSLMIYRGPNLIALLPANLSAEGQLMSHEGLSYGGFIFQREVKLSDVLGCFRATLCYLNGLGIEVLCYKQIPRFFNTLPADEEEYALFLLDAQLYRRDCALTINYEDRLPFQKRRERGIRRAKNLGVTLKQDEDYKPFWEEVLTPRLRSKHGVDPVHSVEEITLLSRRFQENIKLFTAYIGNKILAGTVMYEKQHVAHSQYIAVSESGSNTGALDYLFHWLIEEVYKNKKYFDFGICNEDEGRSLNHGLLSWKQGFGARVNAHNFYKILTGNYSKLDSVLLSDANQL